MKKTKYPTRVNLRDLEDEGEDFVFNRGTGELNTALTELIGSHDYAVNIRLTPAGNAFEIIGKISTSIDTQCARCGRDMVLPIEDDFQEMIVIEKEKPRAGHSGHTGGDHEGIFCNYVTSYDFNLAEFAHEHIAAAEPYTPLCTRPDCEQHFQAAQGQIGRETETGAHSPFEVLKNLTTKGQRD